jgi:xanthine/uracil/vitamin C permease (AzgA family)
MANIHFCSRTFGFGDFQQTQNTAVFLATTQTVVRSKVKEYVESNTNTSEELQYSIVQILTGTAFCTFLVLSPPSPEEYQLSFKQNV